VVFAFLLVIITVALLLFLLSMVWPPDSPWSPWWRTNSKVAKAMIKLADINKDDILYDLGCGDGTLLLTASSSKGTTGVGIEIDPSRVFIARVRILLDGLGDKITIKRKNLFDEDISRATVVSVYLIPQTLRKLESKFIRELRPGTRVISYVYPIDYLPQIARDEKNHITIYEIPRKKVSKKKA